MRVPRRTVVGVGPILLLAITAACSATASVSPAPPGASAGANGASTTTPGGVAAASTAASPTPRVTYDGAITVDGGRLLSVQCVGRGTPTILLEGGGVTPSLDAFPPAFLLDLGERTTACRYSRAGGGDSTPAERPRTMASIVADAYRLLAGLKEKAGVSGPYVFAGWSLGGEVALAEALEHPEQTAGLVIMDTDFPALFMPACLKSGRTQADCQAEYDGDAEAKAMDLEVVPRIHPFPGIPIQLVTAMRPDPDCAKAPGANVVTATIAGTTVTAPDCVALWVKIADRQFAGWRTLGAQVVQTRVDASHDGLIDDAGAKVEAAILAAVSGAR